MVRHRTLNPAFAGSNPATPANLNRSRPHLHGYGLLSYYTFLMGILKKNAYVFLGGVYFSIKNVNKNYFKNF